MPLTPGVRKAALTAHVTISVGWLGAVAGFLALAVSGLMSRDAQLVRAAYLAMDVTGWFVIVPLGLATLPTGLIMSLGTEWGLFRHYWIVAKLLITVVATTLLLVHMQPVGHLARAVAAATLANGELGGLRVQMVADAGAAFVALLVATTISIYKPRGLTPYAKRLAGALSTSGGAQAGAAERWARPVAIAIIVLAVGFVVMHLAGGGMHGH